MVGVGTVIADDPLLTCRLENGRNPVRIICDSHLRIPFECKIVKTAKEVPTIIATVSDDEASAERLRQAGCRIIKTAPVNGRVDLKELVRILGSEKTDSILLEGGGELNWSALSTGIVNKVQAYIAPKIFGGNAKTPVGGEGVPFPSAAVMLETGNIVRIGDDILIESRLKNVYGNN